MNINQGWRRGKIAADSALNKYDKATVYKLLRRIIELKRIIKKPTR